LGRAGQGGLELEPGLGEAAPGQVGQPGGGDPAHLRLQRVVEVELEAAAEVLPEAGADLGPPVGAQDDMDAEVEAECGQLADLRLQLG
jgi:hypothetical protein